MTGTATSFLYQPDIHTKAEYRAALLTYPGNLQQALKDAHDDPSKTMFGVGQGIASTSLTKVMASTKPDFIWFDVEHGMFNRLSLYDAIHAAQHHSEGKTMVVVRVPKHDEISLTTALDAGAAGIVIPHVESADEVKAFIKEMYYPPLGHRSFSPWTFTPGISDASLYPNDPFNMTTSNKHVCLIPQIESVKGIENVEEIAAVEGVSALMFGPGDFMADAGIPLSLGGGEPDPRFLEAMGRFAAAGKKYRRPLVGGAQQLEHIPMMVEQGYRMIASIFDVWHIAGMVHGNLTTCRGLAKGVAETAQEMVAVGGREETNDTAEKHSNGIATDGKN